MPEKIDYVEIEGLSDLDSLARNIEVGETKKIRIDPKVHDGVVGNTINMMMYLSWEFHQKHDIRIKELDNNYFSFEKISPTV